MRAMLLLALVPLLSSCDGGQKGDPAVDIQVLKLGTDYVFTFRTCGNHRVEVPTIEVTRGVAVSREARPQCKIETLDPAVDGLTDRWKYGTTPPGYRMKSCASLQPGNLYEVQVDGAAGGRRVFVIRGDGTVEQREGSCAEKR
jgi:hypothetical protein